MKKFNKYLFRCSSLGNIMVGNSKTLITDKQRVELDLLNTKHFDEKITDKQNEKRLYLINKRDAPPELSQGSKTHCNDIMKGVLFNRERSFHSKYTDKGNEVEEKGLTLASKVLNDVMFKNEKHYSNDFIKGTPDRVVVGEIVDDIKCSWDLHTFPLFEDYTKNNLYKWQLKGYAWLTDCIDARLIYCLVDTPYNIIQDELRKLDWAISFLDGNGNIHPDKIPNVVDKISMMIYTREGLEIFCHQDINIKLEWFDDFVEIPEKLRVKKYDIELLDSDIEQIKEQVILSREYMNTKSSELV